MPSLRAKTQPTSILDYCFDDFNKASDIRNFDQITPAMSLPLKSKVNYVRSNKKNLRNFFRDRLPQDQLNIHQDKFLISPSKVLMLRKQQSSKQQTTSISLKDSIHIEPALQKSKETEKMKSTFCVNKKSSNNFHQFSLQMKRQRHTTAAAGCAEKAIKNKTISSFYLRNSKANLERSFASESDKYPNSFDPNRRKKKSALAKAKTEMQENSELKTMIAKMESYVQGRDYVFPTEQEATKQKNLLKKQGAKDSKLELIKWIKAISNQYKLNTSQMGAIKLNTVDDIQRFDPEFYQEMKKHKKNRLKVRKQTFLKIVSKIASPKNSSVAIKDDCETFLSITDRCLSNLSCNAMAKANPISNSSAKGRAHYFRTSLINSIRLAKRFSIAEQNIYNALWKLRKPFELEGSYGFFKHIKAGNIEAVQKFLEHDIQFLHQIDNDGRTTLMSAVQNNHKDLVSLFVDLKMNLDKKSYDGKTALYYALKLNNHQVLLILLRGGASPWTMADWPLSISQQCSQKVKISLKNARKLQIATQLLSRMSQKANFWSAHRQLIQEQYIFSFL